MVLSNYQILNIYGVYRDSIIFYLVNVIFNIEVHLIEHYVCLNWKCHPTSFASLAVIPCNMISQYINFCLRVKESLIQRTYFNISLLKCDFQLFNFQKKPPNIQMHEQQVVCIAIHISFLTPHVLRTIYYISFFIFSGGKFKFLLLVFFTSQVSISIRVSILM